MPKAGTKVMMFVATAAEWAVPHEILEENWVGIESDTGLMKLGDGATKWVDLGYINSTDGGGGGGGSYNFGTVGNLDMWFLNPGHFFSNMKSPLSISNFQDFYTFPTVSTGYWATLELAAQLDANGLQMGISNYMNIGGANQAAISSYGMWTYVTNQGAAVNGNPNSKITGHEMWLKGEKACAGMTGDYIYLLHGASHYMGFMRGVNIDLLTGYSTVPEVTGYTVTIKTGSSGGTITNARGLWVKVDSNGSSPHTFTDVRGVSLDSWTNPIGSTFGNIYGIYADTSIDQGAANNYFIYSLSTSRSLFSGPVLVPDEVYGAGWNGSMEVPTKNAVYDKIEALVLGGDITVPDEAYGVGWDGSLEVPTKNSVYDKIEALALGGGGGIPGGSTTHVQFNDAGVFAGDTSFLWDKTTKILTIQGGKAHIFGSTEQLRVGYDASNYLTTTVGSAGTVTFRPFGSATPGITVIGGTGAASDGTGGAATIQGGPGGGTNGNGGNVRIRGGAKQGSGSEGTVQIGQAGANIFAAFDVSNLTLTRIFSFPNTTGTFALTANPTDITVPDEAYGAGWNGSLEVPTKNALYDKIETLGAGGGMVVGSPISGGDASTILYKDAGGNLAANSAMSYDGNSIAFVGESGELDGGVIGGTIGLLGGNSSSYSTAVFAEAGGPLTLRAGDGGGCSASGGGAGAGGTVSIDAGAAGAASGGATPNVNGTINLGPTNAKNINIGNASGNLGFYGATPVVRPAGVGEATGFTAGAGTAVNDQSTFTGNVGSTAYRINDIVKALKQLGLITS